MKDVAAVTPSQAPDWRETIRRRIGVASAFLLLWAVGVEARLVYLQVYRHDHYLAKAARQKDRTVTVAAKRGDILDRDGRVLAYSIDVDTIYAVPAGVKDKDQVGVKDPETATRLLCEALADCSTSEKRVLFDRLKSSRSFVYVRRQVTQEQARRVAALQLAGVGLMSESQRRYPNRELAAHLLGYVGLDNGGLAGLEATYDRLIKGEPGKLLLQTDARQHAFSSLEQKPTSGATLELTIDQRFQHIVERELEAGVQENGAEGGTAVMMDPWSGEILAMASWPTFNPNDFRDVPEAARRNRAVQDIYEPGSTFKVVTASAALEQKVVRPDDLIDARGGAIRIGSRTVHDTHDYGVLSFTDVIVKSSNVGAIRVGLRLGPDRLSDYVRRFGFGRPASPDFPGESAGIVWDPAKLTDSALASMSMGYQVSVTPLQMATAVSSVANGGRLFQPRVVRAVIRDGRRQLVPHKVMNTTVAAPVATELTGIMEQVVERGTARAAQVGGFTIAGKTGTAAQLVNGRYSSSEWNASFVGFVPSRHPEFTLIVVIDSPHTKGHTGGVAAAPVFKRIAEAVLRQRGVPPTVNPQPPVLVSLPKDDEGPDTVKVQVVNAQGSGAVPDLRGASARDAVRVLSQLGLMPRVRGEGIVVSQDPSPGSPIERGGYSTLFLARRPSESTGGGTE